MYNMTCVIVLQWKVRDR